LNIHSVKSNQEVLLLLSQLNNRVKVIFHGFNNKLTTANQLINQGYFLSFGKALLKQNSNATKVLKSIPYEIFFSKQMKIKIFRLKKFTLELQKF